MTLPNKVLPIPTPIQRSVSANLPAKDHNHTALPSSSSKQANPQPPSASTQHPQVAKVPVSKPQRPTPIATPALVSNLRQTPMQTVQSTPASNPPISAIPPSLPTVQIESDRQQSGASSELLQPSFQSLSIGNSTSSSATAGQAVSYIDKIDSIPVLERLARTQENDILHLQVTQANIVMRLDSTQQNHERVQERLRFLREQDPSQPPTL